MNERPSAREYPELRPIADLVVERGAAPQAAVAVAERSSGAFRCFFAVSGGRFSDLGAEPVFDLASVTKSFVAVAMARLVRQRAVRFDTPVSELVPETAGTPTATLPLILLLAHRGGLHAYRSFHDSLVAMRPVERSAALSEAASARRDDCVGSPPVTGFPPLYSDLGYLLVGVALERLTGLPLDDVVEREVSGPLGLEVRSVRRWLKARERFHERSVPTEFVPFRGGEVRGMTHDENAWALAGHGLAGHAGLFGTASSVARFGAAVLDARAGRAGAFLTADELEPLLVERPGGSLRAGFDGKSGPSSSAGSRSSQDTFGHLGFTGTSIWCDPAADRATVLLTNRVCPTRENVGIRALRPLVHDALHAAPLG